MLIAIDAEPANREHRTGVENVAFDLIKNFIKIDGGNTDVRYLLLTAKPLRSDWPELPANFKHKIVKWPVKYLYQFRLGLELALLRPDVTFIPANLIPPLVPGRVVTAVHDIVFIEKPEYSTGKVRLVHTYAMHQVVGRADSVIVPTQTTKNAVLEHYPSLREHLVYVPWSYNEQLFKQGSRENDQNILQDYGLQAHKYLLFVGRLEKKKNTDLLLSTYRKFRKDFDDIDLALVGSNTGGYIFENEKHLGSLPTNVLPILYKNALAFVFPSEYEGFGIPLLEAQASGCPVLASDISVLREVAGGGALYANVHNEADFLQKLITVSTDVSLRQKLVQNGFNNVAKYSWERSAEKVLNSIKNIG